MINFSRVLLMFVCLAFATDFAMAGVTAERTRVIMAQNKREASLLLANFNTYPVLVQTWVDDGRRGGSPEVAQAPVMPLPPMFRMEPEATQTLRLLFTAGNLPEDRESLYWLNIYEVPPEPTGVPAEALMAVTFLTQMKLILRPEKLEKTGANVEKTLRFVKNGQALQMVNSSPHYITLAYVNAAGATLGDFLLAPFSQESVSLSDHPNSASIESVTYAWIDDDGGQRQATQRVQSVSTEGKGAAD